MIFQSMASNYTYLESWWQLLSIGGKRQQAELKSYLSNKYGGQVTLYSKGRAALTSGLNALPPGEVAICGLTCYSVVQAIQAAGRKCVFVDINKDSLHFGEKELKQTLEKNSLISVVIVQNTLGIPADMSSIEALVRKHSIVLIEDLAHSIGICYADGREAGTVGDLVMLSFGREKMIEAGSGGALIVRNENFILQPMQQKNTSIINQVRDKIYPLVAWKSRLFYNIGLGKLILSTTYKLGLAVRSADGEVDIDRALPGWQCRIVLRKFKQHKSEILHRQNISREYLKKINSNANLPKDINSNGAVLLRLPVYSEHRESLWQNYKQQGYHLEDTWYDTPVGPKRLSNKIKYPSESCPNAVWVADHLVNLPTHRKVTPHHLEEIVAITNKVVV